MIMLVTGNCPISSVLDFAKKAVEESAADPIPDYIHRSNYYKFGGDGIILYALFEIDEGMEKKAIAEIESRMLRFGLSIEGLKWTLEPLVSLEEVFAMLGSTEPLL